MRQLRGILMILLTLGGVGLHAVAAQAFTQGTPITTDSRIKTFVYNENDVYRLLTHYGYQLNIEFGRKEQIQTISVGDRTGWQIIPNGERLFVRAMEDKAHTNMTVVTDKHAYQFDLYSAPPGQNGWDELVYVVRFYYPDQPRQSGQSGGAIPPAAPAFSAAPSFSTMPPQQYAAMPAAPPPMPPPAPMMMAPPSMVPSPMPPPMPMARPMAPPPIMAAPQAPMPIPQALPPLGSGGYIASPPPVAQAPAFSVPASPYVAPDIAASAAARAGANNSRRGGVTGMAVLAPPRYGVRTPISRIPGASPISFDGLAPAAGLTAGLALGADYYAGLLPLAEPAPTPGYNYNYSFTGEQTILPSQMFDDGMHTYLVFPTEKEKPELFVVTENGKERQVQLSSSNGYLTAPGVYARMTLRHGKTHACIYNETKSQF